jgi:hypothetical protein
MQTVDRAEFMAWTEGVFLDRKKDGSFVAPNEAACQAAQDAVDRDEKVALLVDNKIYSFLVPKEDCIEEELI